MASTNLPAPLNIPLQGIALKLDVIQLLRPQDGERGLARNAPGQESFDDGLAKENSHPGLHGSRKDGGLVLAALGDDELELVSQLGLAHPASSGESLAPRFGWTP